MDPLRVVFNGDLTTGQDYSDNASRFHLFSPRLSGDDQSV